MCLGGRDIYYVDGLERVICKFGWNVILCIIKLK